MFSTKDTIVAIATPRGHGGIGIVRLSGPSASAIAERLLSKRTALRPRYATFGTVVDPSTSPPSKIDEVVATWFQAPRSYTGEDVVEIGAHGSPAVLEQVVEIARREGARLAEPGEFTLRAYLNGRLDLIQAEAVADLVDAVTPMQARTALDQLEGTLTGRITAIESELFDLSARLEASLDFPEEGFHFVTREESIVELGDICRRLEELARDGRRGRLVRDGAVVAIAGRPNAGKSSLFNVLVGADRAIVTDVPGTTRDVLAERVDIGGVLVTLFDTAGVREAQDAIEAEGVRRARAAHDVASLVLVVIDGAEPLSSEDVALLRDRMKSRVVVINKNDLPRAWPTEEALSAEDDPVSVSARTGAGLDELRTRIVTALTDGEILRDTPAMSNVRHLGLVEDAVGALVRAQDAMAAGATEEVVLADLSVARAALESIVGRRSPEDLLRHIFSRFCIGK